MRNFKKAVAAALAFILCCCLCFDVIVWPYFHGEAYFYEDAHERDALAGTIDTLVSGASHAASAFDTRALDDALGVNSYNLAGNLMSMEGRKTLLDKELARNPVKTLIIELSFNTLTRNRQEEGVEGDLYVLGRLSSAGERLRFASRAFEDGEYLRVAADTIDRGVYAWWSRYMGIPSQVDAAAKGFTAHDAVDQSMTSEEFAQLHRTDSVSEDASWENKEYFWDMIEEAQARGIEVIFITTPLPDRTLAHYDNLEEIHQWYLYYSTKYQCPFIDFNLYKQRDALLPDDTAFYDAFHLSAAGAETFTRETVGLIARLRAGEDISNLFYDSYDQADEALCAAYQAN